MIINLPIGKYIVGNNASHLYRNLIYPFCRCRATKQVFQRQPHTPFNSAKCIEICCLVCWQTNGEFFGGLCKWNWRMQARCLFVSVLTTQLLYWWESFAWCWYKCDWQWQQQWPKISAFRCHCIKRTLQFDDGRDSSWQNSINAWRFADPKTILKEMIVAKSKLTCRVLMRSYVVLIESVCFEFRILAKGESAKSPREHYM
jgi:hypothetical protein